MQNPGIVKILRTDDDLSRLGIASFDEVHQLPPVGMVSDLYPMHVHVDLHHFIFDRFPLARSPYLLP